MLRSVLRRSDPPSPHSFSMPITQLRYKGGQIITLIKIKKSLPLSGFLDSTDKYYYIYFTTPPDHLLRVLFPEGKRDWAKLFKLSLFFLFCYFSLLFPMEKKEKSKYKTLLFTHTKLTEYPVYHSVVGFCAGDLAEG